MKKIVFALMLHIPQQNLIIGTKIKKAFRVITLYLNVKVPSIIPDDTIDHLFTFPLPMLFDKYLLKENTLKSSGDLHFIITVIFNAQLTANNLKPAPLT